MFSIFSTLEMPKQLCNDVHNIMMKFFWLHIEPWLYTYVLVEFGDHWLCTQSYHSAVMSSTTQLQCYNMNAFIVTPSSCPAVPLQLSGVFSCVSQQISLQICAAHERFNLFTLQETRAAKNNLQNNVLC